MKTSRDMAPESLPVREPLRRPVSVYHVIRAACHHIDVCEDDLRSKSRHKRVVLARGVIAYVVRKLTTASFQEVALACGSPNHSTTITAFGRIDRAMLHDPSGYVPVSDDKGKECTLHELVARVMVQSRELAGTVRTEAA